VSIKASYKAKLQRKHSKIVNPAAQTLSLLLASEYTFIYLQRYEEAKIEEEEEEEEEDDDDSICRLSIHMAS
jgi:hypothetical protein